MVCQSHFLRQPRFAQGGRRARRANSRPQSSTRLLWRRAGNERIRFRVRSGRSPLRAAPTAVGGRECARDVGGRAQVPLPCFRARRRAPLAAAGAKTGVQNAADGAVCLSARASPQPPQEPGPSCAGLPESGNDRTAAPSNRPDLWFLNCFLVTCSGVSAFLPSMSPASARMRAHSHALLGVVWQCAL